MIDPTKDPTSIHYGRDTETVQLRHGFVALYVLNPEAVAHNRLWGMPVQRTPVRRKSTKQSRPQRRQSGGAA